MGRKSFERISRSDLRGLVGIGEEEREAQLAALPAAIREDLERTRRSLTDQFDLQFRTELDALPSELWAVRRTTADVMSQFEVIDLLRRTRHLTVQETIDVVADAITTALRT